MECTPLKPHDAAQGINAILVATYGTPGTSAAKQATATVPIVMIVSGDAVATGIVASFARPGGRRNTLRYSAPKRLSCAVTTA